jgi:hypothetical protein
MSVYDLQISVDYFIVRANKLKYSLAYMLRIYTLLFGALSKINNCVCNNNLMLHHKTVQKKNNVSNKTT